MIATMHWLASIAVAAAVASALPSADEAQSVWFSEFFCAVSQDIVPACGTCREQKEELSISLLTQFPFKDDDAPTISIISPNLTTKWFDGSDYVQVVELLVQNTDATKFLTKGHKLQVTVDSPSLDTVIPGAVHRLAPGQRALVQVGVRNKEGVPAGAACSGKATASAGPQGREQTAATDLSGACGIGDFASTAASLLTHRPPDWFNKIKYGIFIHWGLYSVPAYGSTGKNENYAEW